MNNSHELVLRKIGEAKTSQARELDLSNTWGASDEFKLTEIPSEIFELEQLEVLKLGHNLLTSVPALIGRLQNLRELDLTHNQLVELPDTLKALLSLTSLNLSSNKLETIPEWLSELPSLRVLDLGFNRLKAVPRTLSRMKQLTSLKLSNNSLKSLPEWISQLQNLEDLQLVFMKLTAVPEWISKLMSLRKLGLAGNELSIIPEWIGRLPELKALDISGNKLSSIPQWIGQIQKLEELHLNNLALDTAPEWISHLPNLELLAMIDSGLTSLPESISELEKLRDLNLSGNQLRSIPESVFRLKSLEILWLAFDELDTVAESITNLQQLTQLSLVANNLTTLPESISQLNNLTLLRLGNNLFEAVPEALYEIPSLIELGLGNSNYKDRNQNQIRELSPKLLDLKNLESLDLENNPIETPPPEIVNRGLAAIKEYFRQLEAEGTDYLYEAKLLIVGEGGAGKTSLAKKIEDPKYVLREEEDSTKGIEVIQWVFPLENGQPFRANIWDFGGQEIYHSTHQFFLTKRSLYVLVADARKEDTDFYYWLSAVELLSDNSPLLIVCNEKKERQREINERQLRGNFSNLKETLPTNLATNRGLDRIIAEIKHYITHLPQIGAPLPKTWVKVREALEKDTRNFITLDEYLNVCEQNGFSEQKDKLQLSGYLHDLGVCLHFQEDALLKKTVILKPKWGTDAVYKVLDNEKVFSNFGEFNWNDLTNIWHESEYANMQGELLQLMINFKLCYTIPNSNSYIAPQRLTENQPDFKWDEANNLILRYSYESFMPKGILTQFIVAMHKLIAKQDFVWKSGVVLEKDQTKAVVLEDYKKREVRIRVAGKNKRELLTIVSYELDNIHATYRRLKYTKLIPCNCELCKVRQDPYFYSLEVLQKFLEDRQENIQCQSSYKLVDVRSLIDDVLIRQQGDKEAKQKGDFIFQGAVGRVVIQQTERGTNIVEENDKGSVAVRSAWANGSFYLFTFAVVIVGLGVLARAVPAYALAAILTAGVIFVPLIGALQLKQDGRLSEKGFLELMKMVVGQLPLIGKLLGGRSTTKHE